MGIKTIGSNGNGEGVMAENTADNSIILEAREISKFFPGVKALQKVNMTLRKGEVHVASEPRSPPP